MVHMSNITVFIPLPHPITMPKLNMHLLLQHSPIVSARDGHCIHPVISVYASIELSHIHDHCIQHV
jgi:hypothetical protein